MDDKDKQIIELLEQDSSQSTREISKKTRIPITTVHKRIKKLEAEKIIKRYTIELDYEKIGREISAYMLISADLKLLKELDKEQFDVAHELDKIPEVETVDVVVGGADIVLFVRAKNIKHLDKVLFHKVQKIEGIINTQTLMVMH